MKICSRCEVKKPNKAFSRKHKTCKKCLAKQITAYYASSPSYRKACKENKHRKSLETQKFIYEYLLKHPCVDCGETDPVVLEFDHVRGKKKNEVTSMNNQSMKMLLFEIKKCDVVCANDHRRRTAKRANTLRWKLSQRRSHANIA
jgi:hypothetical protein